MLSTAYTFDVSVYNIFASLVVHGGTCRLLLDGSVLAALTDDEEMTRVAAVPTVLSIARLPPSVKHVEVGGEALTQKAAENVRASVPIYNYYGPTEVAIWCMRRLVVRDELARVAVHARLERAAPVRVSPRACVCPRPARVFIYFHARRASRTK